MLCLDRNLMLLVKIKLVLTLPSIFFTLEVVCFSMFDLGPPLTLRLQITSGNWEASTRWLARDVGNVTVGLKLWHSMEAQSFSFILREENRAGFTFAGQTSKETHTCSLESHLHFLLAGLVQPHSNQAVQSVQHTDAVWIIAPQGCKIPTSRHPCKLCPIPTAVK